MTLIACSYRSKQSAALKSIYSTIGASLRAISISFAFSDLPLVAKTRESSSTISFFTSKAKTWG